MLGALGFVEKLSSDLFFLLHPHFPERNPTVTWCPLEPQRLALAPTSPTPGQTPPIFGSLPSQPLLVSRLGSQLCPPEPRRLHLRTGAGSPAPEKI